MNTQANNTEIATLADIDFALAALEFDDIVLDAAEQETDIVDEVLEEITDEVVEEIIEASSAEIVAADGVLADDLLKDLDLGIERQEAYAEQEAAEADPVGNKEKAATAAATKKPDRKPKDKTAGAATARTPRDISTVAPEFFALVEPDAGADLEAIKTATMALVPTQVKIAEKFENLFAALSVGKPASTYVMIAFGLLDDKKTATSADIIAAYKASGLKEGTARSQSGQIMNLFQTVGIADRASQVLTLRADSKLAESLRAVATK